jgi:hypothetical protein
MADLMVSASASRYPLFPTDPTMKTSGNPNTPHLYHHRFIHMEWSRQGAP